MSKKVAVINDLSGFGRCSLTAAIPVFSVMGVQPCPLPTAVLTNQTGYPQFFCDDYTDRMDHFTDYWGRLGAAFDGICTGYFANGRQIEKVLHFLERFRGPETLLVVDPVMADDGRIYDTYDEALCREVALLARRADVITPNLTELCLLTGGGYEAIAALSEAELLTGVERRAETLRAEGIGTVIVTGVHAGETICNCVFSEGVRLVERARRFAGSYSGTGDLFSAAVCAALVRGDPVGRAVKLATHFLERSIADTVDTGSDRNDGVNFERHLPLLIEGGER